MTSCDAGARQRFPRGSVFRGSYAALAAGGKDASSAGGGTQQLWEASGDRGCPGTAPPACRGAEAGSARGSRAGACAEGFCVFPWEPFAIIAADNSRLSLQALPQRGHPTIPTSPGLGCSPAPLHPSWAAGPVPRRPRRGAGEQEALRSRPRAGWVTPALLCSAQTQQVWGAQARLAAG